MVSFRVLSRTNLADRCSSNFSTSSISFASFGLRTLFLSLRSFSDSRPLFSTTSALFLQNTRGCGYPNTSAPSFAPAVTCATWRLYPLWPLSIVHTSRHHGGVRVCVATRLDAAPILAAEDARRLANFLQHTPQPPYSLHPAHRAIL